MEQVPPALFSRIVAGNKRPWISMRGSRVLENAGIFSDESTDKKLSNYGPAKASGFCAFVPATGQQQALGGAAEPGVHNSVDSSVISPKHHVNEVRGDRAQQIFYKDVIVASILGVRQRRQKQVKTCVTSPYPRSKSPDRHHQAN